MYNVLWCFIYEQKDWKKGFVQGVDTIFHELKHVRQYSELWRADSEKFINKFYDFSLSIIFYGNFAVFRAKTWFLLIL